jgi:dipeptidyl aminopeptidase/acylaminoacyl peptidase
MSRRLARLVATAAALLTFCTFGLGFASASFEDGVVGVEVSYFHGREAAWSPDGKLIAIPAKNGIKLRDVEAGTARTIKAPPQRVFPEPPGRLSWSADGRALRYVTTLGPDGKRGSWLTEVRRDGSGLRQVRLGIRVTQTAWARQGWPMAFSTGYYAYDFDKGPLGPNPALLVVPRFGAAPKTIIRVGREVREATIEEPEFSPDGERILYQRSERRTDSIWTVRPDGSNPRRLGPVLVTAFDATWSPRGDTIAYAGVKRGDLRTRLYVVSSAGGKPRRISDQEILDGPVWSPDGNWVTFTNYEGEIRRVHPDGTGEEVIAELPGEEVRGLLWSPDGRRLAYMARPFPESD